MSAADGRVVFVTRYEALVHASNRNASYGKPVVVYAGSREQAVSKAIDVGWGGHRRDARVTFQRVTQEPVVIPPAASCAAHDTQTTGAPASVTAASTR